MASEPYSAERILAARQLLVDSGVGPGGPPPRSLGVAEPIERSWRRSLSQALGSPASPVPALQTAGTSSERLLRASDDVLTKWSESLIDMRVALFVSDRSGRVVTRRVNEPDHARQLDRAGAAEGFDFSETSLGTNGLGTAMEERTALFVRGAEHVNEALHSLACAGAPICDPVTGRVIGSLSLAAPLDSSDQTMLAIARQAARQVEASIAEAATSGGLSSLIAEFVGASPRVPVIALSRSGLMSSTGALPLVSAGTHVVLWDQLVAHDWSDPHVAVTVAGQQGIARRLRGRAGDDVYIIEVETAPHGEVGNPTRSSSVDGLAATTEQLSRLLNHASRTCGTVTIHGPPGSGKGYLAVRWLRARDGRQPTVVAAPEGREPHVRARIHRLLTEGASVVVRNVDDLNDDDRGWLTTVLESAASPRAGMLVLTVSIGRGPAAIRALVSSRGRDLAIPALAHTPERVLSITQEIAQARNLSVPPVVLQTLLRWPWPSDVCELASTLHAAADASRDGALTLLALPPDMRAQARQLYGIAASEYRTIDVALRAAGGNRSLAAESLGIGRTTLYRKMRQYGLDGTGTLSA